MYLQHACQRTNEATSLLPIIIREYESSASPRDLSPLVSVMVPIVTVPASPTTNQNISDAALPPPDYSMQGPDLACDQEQLDYPARPMTPGEEEIMRIYEDEVYRPPESGYDRETRRFPDKKILCQTREICSAEDEPDAGDTALGRAALHRSDVSLAEDEPDAGDAALGRAALHRSVVSSTEERDYTETGDTTHWSSSSSQTCHRSRRRRR